MGNYKNCSICANAMNTDACSVCLKYGKKTFHFFIPKVLPGLNEIIKWSKQPIPWLSKDKRRIFEYTLKKKECEQLISCYILNYGGRDLNIEKCKIDFKWYEKNKRRDPSNICAGGRKFILDALVSCGTLKNDNWLVLNFTDQFLVDKISDRIGVDVNIVEL